MLFSARVLTLTVAMLSMFSSVRAAEPSTPSANAANFDAVITGGTVYDGTGAEPQKVDFAISGDRIAGVGDFKNAKANTIIDATGLAVAPGFINMLSWSNESLIQNWLVLLYGLVAIALWHSPIYGWLLLVSGWARRATFLWAVLPLLALGIFERVTLGTSHFGSLVMKRFIGFAPGAFDFNPHHSIAIGSLTQLTPGRYLSTPALWIGLVVAAAFLAVAVRLRRYRGPI